jgi:hypothetical protein
MEFQMNKLSYVVLAAIIATGGIATTAPAFAAPSGATFCAGGNNQEQLNTAKQQLADQLQLRTKSTPTIEEWNGCLKVQYTDAGGHTNVALYDPDSLALVNKLS